MNAPTVTAIAIAAAAAVVGYANDNCFSYGQHILLQVSQPCHPQSQLASE